MAPSPDDDDQAAPVATSPREELFGPKPTDADTSELASHVEARQMPNGHKFFTSELARQRAGSESRSGNEISPLDAAQAIIAQVVASPVQAASSSGKPENLREGESVITAARQDLEQPEQEPGAEAALDANVAAAVEAASSSIPAVQVCVRMRPLLGWEQEAAHTSSTLELSTGAKGMVSLRARDGEDTSARTRNFRFDAVLGDSSTQQEAWELANADALVDKVVAGFHATVFAYGQTGSGKTHTMEGYNYNHHNGSSAPSAEAGRARVRLKDTPPEQLGLVPRSIQRLFSRVELSQAKASENESFAVKVSFLQIYKERVYDLLNPVHTLTRQEAGKADEVAGLKMRWHPAKRQFVVENLFEFECSTPEEVLEHYGTGIKNKHVASTAMNVASSRSHTVLIVSLTKTSNINNGSSVAEKGSIRTVISKLALVDLAGSERASASSGVEKGATRFQEAVNINQSLFVLRKVITALSRRPAGEEGGSTHIPYRESKLTSLLQHSIGGNSFLLMMACLSPSDKHYEENLSTLQYASQAANIKNTPTLNLDPKDRLIQQLRGQLQAAHAFILRELNLNELPAELRNVSVGNAPVARMRSYSSAYSTPASAYGTVCSPDSAAANFNHRSAGQTVNRRRSATDDMTRTTGSSATFQSPKVDKSMSSTAPIGGDTFSMTDPASPGSRKRTVSARARLASGSSPRACSEARDLFSATDSMLANYRGEGNSVSRQLSRLRTPSKTPRGKCRDLRPPSMPPPASGLPPLCSETLPRKPTARAQPGRNFRYPGGMDNDGCDGSRTGCVPETHDVTNVAMDSSCSTTASTPPDPAELSVMQTRLAEVAAQRYAENGLWEAIEELRQSKSSLESQLQESKAVAAKLQEQINEMEASPVVERKQSEVCHGVPATVLTASAQEVVGAALAEAGARLSKAALTTNDELVVENERLRLESVNLKDRLDIFYSAMELEQQSSPSGAVGSRPQSRAGGGAADPDGLAPRLERLHTKLVQEALSLRTEVSGLKKKKWILKAIASGGEKEQRRIDDEVQELRETRRQEKNTNWTSGPPEKSVSDLREEMCMSPRKQ